MMGTPRIVSLKTIKIALRRIQLEHVQLSAVQQKINQFSTQPASKPSTASGRRERPVASVGTSGDGDVPKILLTTAVAILAGGAAYYYFNERDPFKWAADQLPAKKKILETKPTVTESGVLKLKNKAANQVECASPASVGTKKDSQEKIQAPVINTKTSIDLKTMAKASVPVEQMVVPTNSLIDKKNDQGTSAKTSSKLDDLKELNLAQMSIASSEKSKLDEQKKILELQKQVENLRAEYEKEFVTALTRQAQVYQETIEHAKNEMKKEFERRLQIESEITEAEQMVELKAKYGQATAALAAMEVALRGRRDLEILSEGSRKLWTYCNSFFNAINYQGTADSLGTICLNKKFLLREFQDDPFSVQLLNTLPDCVESTNNLKQRFFNVVESSCRKMALFKKGEEVTLWKYLLGMIQGSLVTKCEGQSQSLKTPFEILDRTAFHLQRGEILEAAWILNKIDGLPREICRDWLKDARKVLEVNQTLYALMAHANASNARVN